jgi:hypothetical protein
MLRFRNYWIYSIGLAIVWAVVLALVLMSRGSDAAQSTLLVFLGYCLGWVSTTIARLRLSAAKALARRTPPAITASAERSAPQPVAISSAVCVTTDTSS